ncbi:MAG: hypothetical protein K5675_02795 [Lachnospiraceae bacterium]|nr:hypothetical protein [Lachnospiraceae bacterium]
MDRNEYKAKIEEIRKLIQNDKKEEALELLREENWKKVPNVNILLQAGELFEACGDLEEAKDLLEIGHERSPIGRMIIYRLAIIAVKMGNLEAAAEYYDEFVEIAPHDSLKYVIRYEINRAKGADNDTLISILEELKAHDFMEEWAYELAHLYHKSGVVDKCIDLCDELILWFGDGPYVERALELKMLYHPLDKNQEDKYRKIQQKKDGITEIIPGEEFGTSEILHKPIQIPEVEVSADKYNTINLQAEIKKNIEEIMQATESAEIDENLEAIKGLVEDLPFLQIQEEDKAPESEEKKEEDKKLDETLKLNFQEYLTEAHDGQVSFVFPDTGVRETPIQGQMTIEDVMANWEKTRAAAKAALDEAEQMKFEQTKAKAISEATQIMDRLEEASPKLDAGMSPQELMKEEYLSKDVSEEVEEQPTEELNLSENEDLKENVLDPSEETEALKENRTFSIPKIEGAGVVTGVGLEIPVVSAAKAAEDVVAAGLEHAIEHAVPESELNSWTPPELESSSDMIEEPEEEKIEEIVEEPEEEKIEEIVEEPTEGELQEKATEDEMEKATQIVADLNKMLQNEIDRISGEEVPKASLEQNTKEVDSEEVFNNEPLEKTTQEDSSDESFDDDIELPKIDTEEFFEEEETEAESASDDISKEELDSEMLLADSIAELMEKDKDIQVEDELTPEQKAEEDAIYNGKTIDLGRVTPDISLEKELEREVIEQEMPQFELTADEKEIFSYFIPIVGMEKNLCQVLTGVRARLSGSNSVKTGNILIQGGKGSGKTTLATNIIKVLQEELGKPSGNVGKIDGARLNEKDIKQLFAAVAGGCLIVEKAGDINVESAVTLSLLMENDDTGMLVIFEDTKENLRRLMNMNGELSKKFTERINIPVLTIDELVNFGKTYALELGYSIDELGILALYDKINIRFRPDHPVYITGVKEIVDEAIDYAERGGLGGFFGRLGGKHYDDEGNLILQEKDFQEE